MYISLYVDVNTFIGGRQPQNKLMRLRTFKKERGNTAPVLNVKRCKGAVQRQHSSLCTARRRRSAYTKCGALL